MLKRYVEIEDDSDPDSVYVFDIDFLLSSYRCTYGGGCQGHRDTHPPVSGCCTFGVEVTKGDRKRIKRLMPELIDSGLWENADVAEEEGWLVKAKDSPNGSDNTRVHKGICIFSNRGDKPGCIFHVLATEKGDDPYDYKPSVCRNVPLSTNIHAHQSGKSLIIVAAWDHYTFDPERMGNKFIDWACPQDEVNYMQEMIPVFYRFRRALIHYSTEEVVDKLQQYLEQMHVMEEKPVWQPVAFSGRRDGRLDLNRGDVYPG
jgi:hypothetical protein